MLSFRWILLRSRRWASRRQHPRQHSWSLLGNEVHSPGAPGIAAPETSECQVGSSARTVAFQRLQGKFGARRREPARAPEPWAEEEAIRLDDGHENLRQRHEASFLLSDQRKSASFRRQLSRDPPVHFEPRISMWTTSRTGTQRPRKLNANGPPTSPGVDRRDGWRSLRALSVSLPSE